MSKPRLSLEGETFGKLTVLSKVEPHRHRTKFTCACECGNTTIVVGSDLKTGNTTSCGCVKKTTGLTSNLKHGAASRMTGAYRSWRSMKQRCTNENSPNWKTYGGNGVTVCSKWLESFDNFIADMGERPEGYSLERMDVTKGYSPENCKWIPLKDQCKNKRNTVLYEVEGVVMTQADTARFLNLHASTLTKMRRSNSLPENIRALSSKELT